MRIFTTDGLPDTQSILVTNYIEFESLYRVIWAFLFVQGDLCDTIMRNQRSIDPITENFIFVIIRFTVGVPYSKLEKWDWRSFSNGLIPPQNQPNGVRSTRG